MRDYSPLGVWPYAVEDGVACVVANKSNIKKQYHTEKNHHAWVPLEIWYVDQPHWILISKTRLCDDYLWCECIIFLQTTACLDYLRVLGPIVANYVSF